LSVERETPRAAAASVSESDATVASRSRGIAALGLKRLKSGGMLRSMKRFAQHIDALQQKVIELATKACQ